MSRSPYVFDKAKADAAVAFFPKFLRHVDGEWAGKPFHLTDWQAHHTREIFGWRHRSNGHRRYRFVRGWVPRKNGKGLSLDTPIPTPSGWTTMGQLAVGDVIYDDQGCECRVVRAGDVRYLDCYEIEFSNGEIITCDGDHLWLTTARVDRPGVKSDGAEKRPQTAVRDTRTIFETQKFGKRGDRNHSMSMPEPLFGRHASLPINPYVLGAWLGDGTSASAKLTAGAQDAEEMATLLRAEGLFVKLIAAKTAFRLSIGHTDLLGDRVRRGSGCTFQATLKSVGLVDNKHVPRQYLRASEVDRWALLQGLMDTDGYCAKGRVLQLVTTSAVLADGYGELLASLGLKFSRIAKSMRCNGKPVPGTAFSFQFWTDRPIFRLRRKLDRQRAGVQTNIEPRSRTVQIVDVRRVATVPTRCIQVDSMSSLFRVGRTMLPTHNSTWFAGLGHLLCIGDGEPGSQVYVHALDFDQAAVCFNMAATMVGLSPKLSQLYEVTKKGMLCTAALNSVFVPLSGEAYGKHGLSPHANIGDEVHGWKNGKLHTFLIQGMGARRQPLDLTISTAGEIKTYGHELFESSMAILNDPTLDPETYAFVYQAEKGDDWTDPDIWAKANPNLDVSLKRAFLESECRRALQTPRLENDFKRYHLNLWVEQAQRWFPMHKWSENTAKPRDRDYWKELPNLARKQGWVCYGGLDLGSTSDITCVVWVLKSPEGRVVLIPRFWVPEDTVDIRDSVRTPYKRWIEDGALLTTPGNVTDYDFIESVVLNDASDFGAKELAYDPWNATQVAIHLTSEGLECKEFRQGYASMAAASKETERLFISGQLEHGNHPVLEWMFSNATYRKDPAGNIKPDKERAAEKIDGVVGTVMGVGLLTAAEIEAESIYEKRDLLIL